MIAYGCTRKSLPRNSFLKSVIFLLKMGFCGVIPRIYGGLKISVRCLVHRQWNMHVGDGKMRVLKTVF